MIDTGDIAVFLGLDIGKGEHHATAVTPAGRKAFDEPPPNSEPKLRGPFARLKANHETVLVVVDQPASIGALPVAVARDTGCSAAYLAGLAMGRIAGLYPGEATRVANRLHGLLTQIHPSLERVLGLRLQHVAVLTPAGAVRVPGSDTQGRPRLLCTTASTAPTPPRQAGTCRLTLWVSLRRSTTLPTS